MQELVDKKPELISQAVFELIYFLSDYFGSEWPGMNEHSPPTRNYLRVYCCEILMSCTVGITCLVIPC